MLRKLHIIFFVFLGSCTLSFAAEVKPMNVLFIGNSYTHTNSMPELFEKIATSKGIKIYVEMSAKSSHSFRMHSERLDMYDQIKSKKWDYIVLQGFSRELSFSPEYIDTASIPFINRILDSIYVNNPCTNVLLYETWGYKEGFNERDEINTHEKMSDSIRRGYQYISEIFALPIVPVGNVWKEVNNISSVELYAPDGQHPALYGTYLIAYTFYSAIFKSSPFDTYLTKRIDKKTARLLQESAFSYVNANLDTFKLVQNTLKVKMDRNKKGEFFAHCTSNYPRASGVKWYFGDGQSSDKTKVSHQYNRAGSYWVTLIVEDACGTRTIKRKVKFQAPKKPSRRRKSKPKVILDSDNKIY